MTNLSPDADDLGHLSNFATMEERHFWFRSRNQLLVWALERHFPKAQSFLDIGCRTGFVLSAINRKLPSLHLYGSELRGEDLAHVSRQLQQAEFFQMDARRISFENRFDVIGAFDVLEHIREDELALSQMHRAVKTGGGLILTVPQHPRLWSRIDELSHHFRRYSAAELKVKAERAGFETVLTTSFCSLLLPFFIISRFRKSLDHEKLAGEFKLNSAVNSAFEAVLGVERRVIQAGFCFPIGSSLLLVARKK